MKNFNVIIIVLSILLISYASYTPPVYAKDSIVYNSEWNGSVRQVVVYLKRNLKDPKSFDAISWSDVIVINRPGQKYMVRCTYRAKNSFGGYVITESLFYLNSKGNVVNVISR